MQVCFRGLIVASMLAASCIWAADEKKPDEKKDKKPTDPNQVEVRFNDGSKMKLSMKQENVEIQTAYGKLTIPVKEIRRIEVGQRFSEETTRKLEDALKDLASENFDTRKTAKEMLIGLGPIAYLPLQREAKSTDPEVSKAAKSALEKIRETHSEDQLKIKLDDFVQTDRFPISGKIVSDGLKAKSDTLGEANLKLTDLRIIRWVGKQGDFELSVEAAKYSGTWLETNIEIDSGDELEITADGKVNVMDDGTGQWVCGPTGHQQLGMKLGGKHLPGALLGRFGTDGEVFVVGDKFKGAVKKEGKLYLQVQPFNRGGNRPASGSFTVKVSGGREG